jgi:hypothetical protein
MHQMGSQDAGTDYSIHDGLPLSVPRTAENVQKRKRYQDSMDAGSASDEDMYLENRDEEASDSDYVDAVPFDVLPSQNEDILNASDVFLIRRIPAIPNLLSLAEVDCVLRGAFKAPRGLDGRQLRAAPDASSCGQDNRRKRLGVRLPPSAFSLRPGTVPLRPRQQEAEENHQPVFSNEELDLEPLVLWDTVAESADESEACIASLDSTSTAKNGDHAFVLKTARLLQEYRRIKGLNSISVVVEPFLCR